MRWSGGSSWFCLTIDFTKLYNMIDPDIVALTLQHMGLRERCTSLLLDPVTLSKGHWRLPHGAASTPYAHDRGIPQGLSTSVFASEIFVSILCWKLQKCSSSTIIGYVDDLTLCSGSCGDFLRVLGILERFVSDFALQMNSLKSSLWGTNTDALQEISREKGFALVDRVTALGAEWALTKKNAHHRKKMTRIELTKDTLRRLKILHVHPWVKINAISTGCLAAIDFALPPCVADLRSLRMCVKQALSVTAAAPEILYHFCGSSTIDPLDRWFLVQLRLWRASAIRPESRELLLHTKKSDRQSRWAALLKEVDRLGWKLDALTLTTKSRTFPLSRSWSLLRLSVISELKCESWTSLAARRLKVYEGLTLVDVSAHSKLLKSLPSYSAVIIIRV